MDLVLSSAQRRQLEAKKTVNRAARTGSSSSAVVPGPRCVGLAGFGEGERRHFMSVYDDLHNCNHAKKYEFIAKDITRSD